MTIGTTYVFFFLTMSDSIASPQKTDLSSWITLYNIDTFQNVFSIPQYTAKQTEVYRSNGRPHLVICTCSRLSCPEGGTDIENKNSPCHQRLCWDNKGDSQQCTVTLHKAHIMAAYLEQVSDERRTVATTIASLQIPSIHNHEHFKTAFVLRDPTNSSAETASLHNLNIYYGRI